MAGSRSSRKLSLRLEDPAASGVFAKPELEFIEADELGQLLGDEATRGRLILIDVRQADHVGGHISGSHHIPFGDFEEGLGEVASAHGRGKTLVVYCMYSQQRGPSAAASLLRHIRADCDGDGSESKVLVLRGGFHRWLNRWLSDEDEAAALIEGYEPRQWKYESERMGLVHIADHPETALNLALQQLSAPAPVGLSVGTTA